METREAFAIRRLWWVVQQCQEEQILPTRRKLVERAHLWPLNKSVAVKQAIDEAMDLLLKSNHVNR